MKYLLFYTTTTILRKGPNIKFLRKFPTFLYLRFILFVRVTRFLNSVIMSACSFFRSGHLLFRSSSLRTSLCFLCVVPFSNRYNVLWNVLFSGYKFLFTEKLHNTPSGKMQKNLSNTHKIWAENLMEWRFIWIGIEFASWIFSGTIWTTDSQGTWSKSSQSRAL